MKKMLSILLAAVMLVSAVPTAFAADTRDYSQGTQVVFEAANNESYTITVPASLQPGQSGTVTLSGSWPSNKTISVTAESTVTLTNSILETDQKVLDITFLGIEKAGNDTTAQTFTETVSVEGIENALFGTWSGKFNYNVDASDGKESQTAFKYGERYFLASIGENYESIAEYLPSEIIGYTDGTASFVVNGVQEDLPVGALIIDGNEIRFADSDDETEKFIISADGTTLTMYNLNQEVAIWTVESALPANPLRYGEKYICTYDADTTIDSMVGESFTFKEDGSVLWINDEEDGGNTDTLEFNCLFAGNWYINIMGEYMIISADGTTLSFMDGDTARVVFTVESAIQ